MMQKRLFWLSSSLLFISQLACSADVYTELVVFGDSHSDTGNWLPHSSMWENEPAYALGRFSDGPVWVETLADLLGVASPVARNLGGWNYAWGAARTGNSFDRWSGVTYPQLEKQIAQYLADTQPTGDELFAIFIGHNDFGFYSQRRPEVPISSVRGALQLLATAGARQLVVPRLHPLGRLPTYRDTVRAAPLNAITDEFNQLLDVELSELEHSHDVSIYRPDFYQLVEDATANPAGYELVDTSQAAYINGSIVANPDEYMYWDSDHFTTAFYAQMGHVTFATVLRDRDGDFDANGVSDGADLLAWQREDATERRLTAWGARFGSPIPEPEASAIPEPEASAIPEPDATFLTMSWLAAGAWRRQPTRRRLAAPHRRAVGQGGPGWVLAQP